MATGKKEIRYINSAFKVIAYVTEKSIKGLISTEQIKRVTHVNYSFINPHDNASGELALFNEANLELLARKVKAENKAIFISLGGWRGDDSGYDLVYEKIADNPLAKQEFINNIMELVEKYHLDGVDLDWEYPAISGFPNHTFKSQDKDNFTFLIQELRNVMNPNDILSFAAGGFPKYLEQSIDWQKVMPLVDHVNIMSYDLYSSLKTGHHTPLYSNNSESYSADSSVKYLLSIGVPSNQIVIGAGFYGRIWENVPNINNGLFQSGNFKTTISHRYIDNLDDGYEFYWDETANATYGYNKGSGNFISIDNAKSVLKKTEYVLDNDLKGIMFWELVNDDPKNSLLKIMVDTVLGK